ncbi:hypothetical protein BHM03_00051755 [Ensete ventricosum]|nr:hypothetical protein BHM03_00051755 [Ensete ventricosum]
MHYVYRPVLVPYRYRDVLGTPVWTDRTVRSTVGTVVSVLLQLERVAGWPELLEALVQCLASNDFNHMEGLFCLCSTDRSSTNRLGALPAQWWSWILQPHLRNVIEYLLQANKDPDDEVSLEACEFWYVQ